ncbi:FixH family protein [Streptomyces sp. RB6PN25]|uniref:FixH family protein n=1 Tax=Streptomyces humicola TaxID=2953240 RepID=A0ABT1PZS3_9ACTN|nr:FixH family protein [Streptomyces humicola]MCQ4083177.1 FixH family protein [Streptomyces humicola]
MTSAKRIAVLLGALAAVLLGTAAPASAHAALLTTDPGQGSVVKVAPTQVLLTFSEGVLLSDDSLRVLAPSGKDVERGTAHHAGDNQNTATVALRPGLGNGTYTVAWKAVSADTHPVAGAWTFSVGAPSATSVNAGSLPGQQPGGGIVGTLYSIGRAFSYGGFALLVGGCAFLGVCWPRGARLRVMQKVAVSGWVTLAASTIALLLLRGPYVNGTGLGGIADLGQLQAAVETKEGAALISRLLLLAAAALFLSVLFGAYTRREDPEERRDLALGLSIGGAVIATGIAATWAMSEHASVGIQPAVAMPVDVLHLLAMAVWLGGLVALVTALYRTTAIERAAVRRFSRIAFGCVCALVGSGIYQAWRQVGSWHALFTTEYGQLLIVKIGLVVLMLGTAAISRRWTARLADAQHGAPAEPETEPQPVHAEATTAEDPERAAQLARQRAALAAGRAKKLRDADPARGGLRRSVLTEAAIAVLVLAVATVLSGSEPGRAVEESIAASGGAAGGAAGGPVLLSIPYDTGGPDGKGTAGVHLDPARTGNNVLHLSVTDASGKPVDVPEVDVALTLPAKNLGPIPVTLRHVATGEWAATSLQLPMPGQWQLSVTVRTDDIDETTVARNVAVGG